jgi:endonuclease/exonuclease/phosphatase family metal-dependent hydrolase
VKIRTLTINLHKGFSLFNRRFVLEELRQAIRASAADLVFLQEVHGQQPHHPKRGELSDWSSQVEYLADEIWSEFAYGKNSVYSDGDHGNAILSKLPIVQFQNTNLSLSRLEKRGLLYCEIEEPNTQKIIRCFNLHLNLLSFHRQKQWNLIRANLLDFKAFDEACILVGDFNDWTQSLHRRILRESPLVEAHESLHRRLARTWPSQLPALQLDRVYFHRLHLESAMVLNQDPWRRLSDHLPISVDFILK